MKTVIVPIHVCGDVWANPEEVRSRLDQADIDSEILIDLRAEGPSLKALGILKELTDYCRDTGRDPASIKLINSPNNQEKTIFENTHAGISHFFPMSIRYWRPAADTHNLAHRFGFFVGRTTVARCSMMYKLHQDPVQKYFKFSIMNHDGQPIWDPYPGWKVIESFDQWLSSEEKNRMIAWWNSSRPLSLDRKKVRDQYTKDQNTNLSLMGFYSSFYIELICETYTLGDTFFPTEKTVRPLVGRKPFLVYASPKFLARLKALGFQTYGEIWDESYDDFEGPERWRKIKEVIDRLCSLSAADFNKMINETKKISYHNRCLLADLVLTDKSHVILQSGIT